MDDQFDNIISGMSSKYRGQFDLMERIRKCYIMSPRDESLRIAVSNWILANMSARHAPNPEGCLLGVVGGAGAGKSTSIIRTINWAIEEKLLLRDSILFVNAPHPCTQKQLALTILAELGYPLKRDIREGDAWRLAKEHLVMNSVRYL
jgi:hypothetical protein